MNHNQLGKCRLYCEGSPELLFTENETNYRRLFGVENQTPHVKDGINNYIVNGAADVVNPERKGTKAAVHYAVAIQAREQKVIRLRLRHSEANKNSFSDFEKILAQRRREADEFYATIIPQDLSTDGQNVMRQGLAGMLWSKQFYYYVIKDWLQGDPGSSTSTTNSIT